MTETERTLLNIIQHDFPLVPRPFLAIAEKAGITEDVCIETLKRLTKTGILRGIRAVISWNRIGYTTLLIGMKVKEAFLDSVAQEINRIDGVTHNYVRDGILNLWFTLIYHDENEKDMHINRVRALQGVEDIKEFPAEKTYKIGVVLDV